MQAPSLIPHIDMFHNMSSNDFLTSEKDLGSFIIKGMELEEG